MPESAQTAPAAGRCYLGAFVEFKKIFLASSSELESDRTALEIDLSRKNKIWAKRGVFLELVMWEDFLDAMSQTGLQSKYNEAIRGCDLFVMLFFTKVGRYTAEEFDTAFGQFKSTGNPLIWTYFKDAQISTGSANQQDLMSLWAFQAKLKELKHYQTHYKNTDALLNHFTQQLDKLVANGFIAFKPDGDENLAKGDSYQATVVGGGGIAQGPGATAAGAGGVVVGGNSSGNINTGTPRNRRR